MPQFDSRRELGKTAEQFTKAVARPVVAMKAGRKLEQDGSEFSRYRQRLNTFLKSPDIRGQDRRFSMRELLPGFDSKFEV